MGKKKPGKGRPLGSGKEVVAFQIRIPPELAAALDSQVEASRRSKNTEVNLALEAYLSDLGLWPPKPPEPQE